MQKIIHFSILSIILVLIFVDTSYTGNINISNSKFLKVDGEKEVPNSVFVYRINWPMINKYTITDFATRYFKSTFSKVQESKNYFFLSNSKFKLVINRLTGTFSLRAKSGNKHSVNSSLKSFQDHLFEQLAIGYLKQYDFFTNEMYFRGKTNSKNLYDVSDTVSVFFGRAVNGIDCEGPGVQTIVEMDANSGKLVYLFIAWRDIVPLKKHSLISVDDAFMALKRGKGELFGIKDKFSQICNVRKCDIIYVFSALNKQQYLLPYYRFLFDVIPSSNTKSANVRGRILAIKGNGYN